MHTMTAMARLKKMTSLAFNPELLKLLDKYIQAQTVPPSKTRVHEIALERFLAGEGYVLPERTKPKRGGKS